VARKMTASPVSKPDQATSQWFVVWFGLSYSDSQSVQGSSTIPIAPNTITTQSRSEDGRRSILPTLSQR